MSTSNVELLRTAYRETHMAADRITLLSQAVDGGAVITAPELLPKVRQVRNHLRRAHCAMETLKFRCKQAAAGVKNQKENYERDGKA